MTVTYNELVEDWIIYLKSKGIVKRNSSGTSLEYIRKPTSSDIITFLSDNEFDRDTIRNAIQSAEMPQPTTTTTAQSTTVTPDPADNDINEPSATADIDLHVDADALQPGKEIEFPGIRDAKFQWNGQQWKFINKKSGKASKIANREIASVLTKLANGQDIDTKEILDARKKLGLFSSKEYTGNKLVETFTDKTYTETQIAQIFKTITTLATTAPITVPAKKAEEEQINELNAIKQSIRDKFTDTQRKALWRLLTNA